MRALLVRRTCRASGLLGRSRVGCRLFRLLLHGGKWSPIVLKIVQVFTGLQALRERYLQPQCNLRWLSTMKLVVAESVLAGRSSCMEGKGPWLLPCLKIDRLVWQR